MSDSDPDQRLSQLQTLWTVVCRAHGDGSEKTVRMAQQQLMARYSAAVRRYLLGALRDADAAAELSQEFALRFLRGDLKRADPQRGRFRDYLKGTLFHLIGDYYRHRKKSGAPLAGTHEPAVTDEALAATEDILLESWRVELIDRAWRMLAREKNAYHDVLRLRAAHPDMRSDIMAAELSRTLGKEVKAPWVRQNLHRARDRFGEILVEEVRQTLDDPTREQLEDELIVLGLHAYCQPVLRETPDDDA
jgi:RNA polymerase sigma-70 factor (ECF subfamily)